MDNTNFRIQDLQKFIIPGAVILVVALSLSLQDCRLSDLIETSKDISALIIFIFIIASYIVGFFTDYLGSLFECLFYKVFAKPSYDLINGEGRCKLSNRERVVEFICDKMQCNTTRSTKGYSRADAEKIFKFSNVLKDRTNSTSSKDRLMEYYFLKIFSRNLCAACFMCLIMSLLFLFKTCSCFTCLVFLSLLLCVVLSFSRWKSHAIYYSRQVFYVATEDMK